MIADGSAIPLLEYKEFKYLNSHNINYDVQIAISRLEFPSDLSVDSNNILNELFLTTHILSNQMALHDVSMSTHFGVVDTFHNSLVWDIVLSFPVKFRDLSSNSMVVFTAWGPNGKPFGGTSMSLFDETNSLKRGKQKLIFYFDRCGDNHIRSETLGELYECYSKYDDNFIKEKKLERYKNSVVSSSSSHRGNSQGANMDLLLDWLDRLVLAQIQSSIAIGRRSLHTLDESSSMKVRSESGDTPTNSSLLDSSTILSPEIQDLYSYCCLVIDLPMFPHPVLFEEKLYPSVAPHLPHVAAQILSVGEAGRTIKYDDIRGPIYEFNLMGKPFSGQALRQIVDWDMDADNPCENMYRRLAHDTIRGRSGGDITAKPNLKEKERLDIILNTPGDHLKPEDKDLMYRFRYILTDNKMALSKFLLSVDWSSDSEINELPTLLGMWKRKAPVDVSEALKLLSGGKAFQNPVVRSYAVDVLRNASDQELHVLLLQLVQALRYEPVITPPMSQRSEEDFGALSPNTIYTSENDNTEISQEEVKIDGFDDLEKLPTSTVPSLSSLSPLGRFLISRACTSTILANYFYWFLKVEIEDSNKGDMFQNVFRVFMNELKTCSDAGRIMEMKLRALNEYIDTISSCQRSARDHKGRKDQKEVEMRRLLSDEQKQKLPYGLDSVPLPLDPSFSATGLDPSTIILFKSAMYPAVIDISVIPENLAQDPLKNQTSIGADGNSNSNGNDNGSGNDNGEFGTADGDNGGDGDGDDENKNNKNEDDKHVSFIAGQTLKEIPENQPTKSVYKIIFKSGDDLRQDQLIMQLIALMDGLLKKVNLDLGLLTYGILATGPTDGIMEFVRKSMPISAVVSEYGRNSYAILNYLKEHNPDKHGPYGMKPQAMDMFVRSCASSCVVTYILGIGDRHLDNIMIRTNGQLFHIDFGFIFGRDPKPLPPPFRFTRHMADAMGGEDSDHYKKFQSYCCQAYNWLRKSANLILNLLSLMVDAGIPDLSVRQDPVIVLKKVEEKFRLDLTDELAEGFFLGLINDSLTALAPRLMEIAHQISVARR